ncbi:prolipoprotein diacylglyceryl transferase [Desulfobotulus alkaliphilus]|uniref:Prolipoprotein diacylglyceryl transferase n=1 Tax=Desulfobotulus alkaliphilus TaxID=622671 RepID=A0A562RY68_9BACT|nr:prolipoprotein diacylglyceryl transferase family protein [Desulfobotulus alkaliphilus]TWI73972.1 prolipoprotein diacylglyceryl transferase [Desulfobotulus alkaliphilus]
MFSLFFMLVLAIILLVPAIWGVRSLPSEKYQMLAACPVQHLENGLWKGMNLTWYGLLSASAYVLGTALGLVLLRASGAPLWACGLTAMVLLCICVPASRWIARIVEGKRHTFTVGGASFLGILLAPWVLVCVNMLITRYGYPSIPAVSALAAMALAYTCGEGMGRLACLSFGCCYGKPIRSLSPEMARFFKPMAIIFHGKTKKISYAHQSDGEAVLPVQALTLFIHIFLCLAGLGLFLGGKPLWALFLCLGGTQIWRVLSEFLRADYRGEQVFSAYQIMALSTLPYIFLCLKLPVFSEKMVFVPDLKAGVALLWTPEVLTGLFILWILTFFYTGRSTVTGSELRFFVHGDRV